MLANVGKNGLHCAQSEDFAGWFVRDGTINSQIVKQEGEYTPEVPDTVTHVPLRSHAPSSSSSLLEILSRNESNESDHKTLHFTTPKLREVEREGLKPGSYRTEKQDRRALFSLSLSLQQVLNCRNCFIF